MTTPPSAAQLAAARAYESRFVPALFGQWATPVLDAAGVAAGHRVLDVGCGTGVVAREASRRVGAGGYVAGLDPDKGMLAVARTVMPSVDWVEGTAEAMPWAGASFDAVIASFGLMFMQSEAALREMLRVVNPSGRVVVAVWDVVDHSPGYAAAVEVLERVAGVAAAEALRAPFRLGDRGHLSAICHAAGAGSVAITTAMGQARFPSVRAMVEADLRGWLPVMNVHLDEDAIARVLTEAEVALQPFVGVDGHVVFAVPAHLAVASRSDPANVELA